MPRNSVTSSRRMEMMKIHLNLRQTMNLKVLHGLVNQKKEVSGRLEERNMVHQNLVMSFHRFRNL